MLVAVLIGIADVVLPESNFRVRKPAKSVNAIDLANAELARMKVLGKCRDFTRAILNRIKTKSISHDQHSGRGFSNSHDSDHDRCTAYGYSVRPVGSG